MNIIWLKADYLFPLDTGGKIRSFHLLKRINAVHPVTYLGFCPHADCTPDESLRAATHSFQGVLKPIEGTSGLAFYSRVAANLGSPNPYFVSRNRNADIRRRVQQAVTDKTCDLLVCDSLDMAINIDFRLPIRKVLFHHAIETTLWRQRYESATGTAARSYFNYEIKRMAAYESSTCNRFDLVIVSSDRDRDELRSEYHVRVPIEVIPVGVDCAYFAPTRTHEVIPRRLMFSGSMDLLSNVDQLLWFASEIYPLIKRRHRDVTMDIVGRYPTSELTALGQKDRSVQVTGWVQDIRPYLAQADIYIVPLRVPGGVRVKLYEAMASRRPVVSTSHGAVGLQVTPGRDIVIADTAREFADAVCDLFDNPARKEAIAEQGWRMVNAQCDWSAIAEQCITVLEHAAKI
jgi:glycosyltransferase involved in cell wall biosynthesis